MGALGPPSGRLGTSQGPLKGVLGRPGGLQGGPWGPAPGNPLGPPPNAPGHGIPFIRTVPGAPERVQAGTGGYQGVSILDVFCEDLCMYPALPSPRRTLRPEHSKIFLLDPPQDPSKTPSFFHRFFDAFLDRFLIDLGSIFPPNLPPKNHKNASKIDVNRHPILDFKF